MKLELLAWRLNFYFSTFKLLTPSWKVKVFISSYWLEVEKQKVLLRVTNSKLKKKKKFHFEILAQSWKIKSLLWVTNWKLKSKKFHFELLNDG